MQQNQSFNWWMAWNEIRLEQRQILQCCAHTVECCGWRTHTMCTPATHNVHIRHIISRWMVRSAPSALLAHLHRQQHNTQHPSIQASHLQYHAIWRVTQNVWSTMAASENLKSAYFHYNVESFLCSGLLKRCNATRKYIWCAMRTSLNKCNEGIV